MVERVQNTFFKYTSYVLRIQYPPHNYLPILEYLKLDSLADRRHTANLKCLSKLLNGKIVFSRLLSLISYKNPFKLHSST